LILSRRRRSASLWILRALASVALLPDPDDDDISGGATRTAGGAELACRGRRTGPPNTEGSKPSYGCSSFPCRGWHAAIQPDITKVPHLQVLFTALKRPNVLNEYLNSINGDCKLEELMQQFPQKKKKELMQQA
jgi:hypothetical protein